jgi:hypothetical protein
LPAYRYWLCDLSAYTDDQIKGEVGLRAAVEGALPEGDAIMSTLAQHWIELGTQRGL